MTERLRFAMVGTGWWANVAHLPAMVSDPTIELVAVVDADGGRARIVADRFGVAQAYSSVDELLAGVAVDCAVVATPHTTHRSIVERLLLAGVDVLVEKPLTTTAEDAWALVELARRLGRTLTVGLTYQYAVTASEVQRLVSHGIGELVCVNAEFSSGTEGLFNATKLDATSTSDPAVPHGTSYSDPRLSGGGQGQTQLTHLLGNLLWNTRTQADEVFAYMGNRGLPVDLVNSLTFRLDGGALGTATSTGTTPTGVEVRHRIRYHGTEAMVEHDLLKAEAWVFERGGGIRHLQNPDHEAAYRRSQPASTLAAVVRGERANPAPADVAAASVSLIEAAYVSADQHRPVEVRRGAIIQEEQW